MRFVNHIVGKRVGLDPDVFSEVWTPEQACLNLCQPLNNYAEFLSARLSPDNKPLPGKLYLDRDRYYEKVQPSPEELKEENETVVRNVQAIVDALSTESNNLSFVIATRHGFCPKDGRWKQSHRPFIQGMSIRYTDIPAVLRYLGQDTFWDMTVYKHSEQLLATINCCKGHIGKVYDGRVLTPQPECLDPLCYLAQYVEDGWALLDLPEGFGGEPVKPCVTDMSKDQLSVCPIFVSDLTACLNSETSDDRVKWLNIGFVLKGLGGESDRFLEDWLAFSKKSSKYGSQEECEKVWAGLTPTGACTVGTLCFHARLDDPTAYAVAKKAERNRAMETVAEEQADHNLHIRAALKKIDAEVFADITPDTFTTTPTDTTMVVFQDKNVGGEIHLINGTVKVDGKVLGEIAPLMVVKDLAQCSEKLHNTMQFYVTHIRDKESGANTLILRDKDPMSILTLQISHLDTIPTCKILTQGPDTNLKVKSTKLLVETVMQQCSRQFERHIGGKLGSANVYFNLTLNQTVNNFGTLLALSEGEKLTDFEIIRDHLWEAASAGGLRKKDGVVYEPIPGCPCAFVPKGTYAEFINEVLREDAAFNRNPKRFDEAMKYLTNYDATKMPWLKTDKDLLSFSNGVLQLASGVFTEYAGMTVSVDGECGLAKRVARHHIPFEYTGCADTPLLDIILVPQFGPEVAAVFCALFGRTFFTVGQLDSWQVMPFLVGVGGTGKSLLLKILEKLFQPTAVGSLAAKREDVFGMANLIDKELVMGRDMPAKMSAALSQDLLQSMTAGEGMEVPRKGLTALHVQWSAPVVMAGNHMPDYVNTGNNIGRRMASIRFDCVIERPQQDLEQRILNLELPNIVCRILRDYKALRGRVEVAGGFWDAVPKEMLEWRGRLVAATNQVEEFLAMDDETRNCTIECVQGAVTLELEFKAAFLATFPATRDGQKYALDPSVLSIHGFRAVREMMCRGCHNVSKGGNDKCCADYNGFTRIPKTRIHNMKLVRT